MLHPLHGAILRGEILHPFFHVDVALISRQGDAAPDAVLGLCEVGAVFEYRGFGGDFRFGFFPFDDGGFAVIAEALLGFGIRCGSVEGEAQVWPR